MGRIPATRVPGIKKHWVTTVARSLELLATLEQGLQALTEMQAQCAALREEQARGKDAEFAKRAEAFDTDLFSLAAHLREALEHAEGVAGDDD